jgi:hypothetical protein
MAHISLLLKHGTCFILALLLPSLALAVFVYEWEETLYTDSTVTGTMIFADSVSFGDIIDPLSDDLVEFSFSGPILSDWSMSDFAYGHFLRPEESGVELDPSGFAIPTDPDGGKKKAAVKAKGGIFFFERGDAYLDFTVSSTAKKKAAKKGAEPDPSLEPYPLWSWFSSGPIDCAPGTACKKSATEPSGEGYWVLKSGTVPVPEPTTFLLLLAGLGIMVSVVKRVRGRH